MVFGNAAVFCLLLIFPFIYSRYFSFWCLPVIAEMDGQKNRSMAKDLSDITFDTWTHQKRVKRMQRQINYNQEKWLPTSNRFRTMALNAQTKIFNPFEFLNCDCYFPQTENFVGTKNCESLDKTCVQQVFNFQLSSLWCNIGTVNR